MDIRNFLRSILQPQLGASGSIETHMEGDGSNGGVRNGADADLRSIVERQFMRMSEAHDRHRTEVLASYSPGLKLRSN